MSGATQTVETPPSILKPSLPSSSSLSGSGLLAKRRTRSRNSNSSSYDLALLSIPQPGDCRICGRTIDGKTDAIRHVQAVERDAANVAQICLRLMVMSRLGPEHLTQGQEMLQEAGCDAPDQPVATDASSAQPATPGGVSGGGSHSHGTCRSNERLARRLASMADEFANRSRAGRRAVECARRMPLPPRLVRADFDGQLSCLSVDACSIRSKVALLLILSAELAARAVVVCNRAAVLALMTWCQELFCGMASAMVLMQGWGGLIGSDDKSPWVPIAALVLTLLLIGCTIGRSLIGRQCR